MEEEIDLREYIEVLLKYKYVIIACTLLAAIAAFLVSTFMPPVYEAEASLAMLRIRSEVMFEPKFKTLSEETLQQLDLKSRREALVALADSSTVAAAVFQNNRERLAGVVERLEDLRGMVEVESKGDLILVKVRSEDPELAAYIANAWAKEAEKHINAVYGQPVQPSLAELQAQVNEAQSRYRKAQEALENFISQSRIPKLEQEIKNYQELIESYSKTLTQNQAAIYNKHLEAQRAILSNYYDELVAINKLLVDVRSFKRQVEKTGTSRAGEWAQALSFINLQNKATGAGGQQLQVVLEGEPPELSSEDVRLLVSNLEEKEAEVHAAIIELSSKLLDTGPITFTVAPAASLSQRIEDLTKELVELQAQLEAEKARQRELESERDLAWETYQTVTRKLAELEIAEQVPGSEVRFAAEALPPERPVSPRRLMNTAIAGTLGLMLGVFGAFFIEYWRESGDESLARP